LGLGTEIDLIAFLASRYMGQQAFGEIYGYCLMIFGLGSSFGRFLGSGVGDLPGSYDPALTGVVVTLVVAEIIKKKRKEGGKQEE